MAIVIHIGGANGVGKTTISQEIASLHSGQVKHFDAVGWLNKTSLDMHGKLFHELNMPKQNAILGLVANKIEMLGKHCKVILLDGHFTRFSPEGKAIFAAANYGVKPDRLIVISPPSNIYGRHYTQMQTAAVPQNGHTRLLDLETAMTRNRAEVRIASDLSREKGIPLEIIREMGDVAQAVTHANIARRHTVAALMACDADADL